MIPVSSHGNDHVFSTRILHTVVLTMTITRIDCLRRMEEVR